ITHYRTAPPLGRDTSSMLSCASRCSGLARSWLQPVVGCRNPLELITRNMATKKHKKVILRAKGYKGKANSVFRVAVQAVTRAMQNAYRDRKLKKRDFRKLWIMRVGAGSRQHGLGYSGLIRGLSDADIELDRKVLAEMAMTEPYSFGAIVHTVQGIAKERKQ
ncbi:unnamed protein product, partial [Chrysoparadoxa australica]